MFSATSGPEGSDRICALAQHEASFCSHFAQVNQFVFCFRGRECSGWVFLKPPEEIGVEQLFELTPQEVLR